MKILHVIGSMDPACGGPCQGIRNSIEALGSKIFLREVVSLDDPSSSFLGKDSFVIHALGPAIGPWCYSPKLMPWLKGNIKRFDVVIINGLWLYPSYAASKAVHQLKKHLRKAGREHQTPKIFVMPHGMLDPYFQNAPERKLKAIRNWFYWKLIERRVVNQSNGLLFTCETELQLARETFRPYQPKKEFNIGYGIVSPPQFTNSMSQAFYEKCPQVVGHTFLLFISRIHPKKGVDLLLNAYNELLNEKTEQQLPMLIIAGPGSDTLYGQYLRELVNTNPQLRSKVLFPGMLTGYVKWGAFYNCDAFVLPSHQENFGIAVVEALACSKPVLISNQINIWKEIEAEGGGIVSNDTQDGAKRVLESWLSLTTAQKQVMNKQSFAVYKKHFEIGKVAHKFLEAISS